MTETGARGVPRADIVGSLLRPRYLREARRKLRRGEIGSQELRAVEDRAVQEAIALQEASGLHAVSDGEYRRGTWVITIPLFDDPAYRGAFAGFEFLEADAGWWSLWKEPDGTRVKTDVFRFPKQPYVTSKLRAVRDIVADEYVFLKTHATARTKFMIPAPSWHRIFWHPDFSRDAYPTSDDFIEAVATCLRDEVAAKLVEAGCDYIQLDAPNYAQWHIDPGNRSAFEAHGHDMAQELVADAEFDNSVFEGIGGVRRAMHVCRGNGPDGRFLGSGGYDVISRQVFPRLTNFDALLLEYDSDRAGGFEPLNDVLSHHTVVLGLVTTKSSALEDATAVERRIREATKYVPIERLALSPQCGFASGEGARTMTLAHQEAKLRLVGDVARRVWGA